VGRATRRAGSFALSRPLLEPLLCDTQNRYEMAAFVTIGSTFAGAGYRFFWQQG
jgi:hypothetical protein